jgi:hypothetical protein
MTPRYTPEQFETMAENARKHASVHPGSIATIPMSHADIVTTTAMLRQAAAEARKLDEQREVIEGLVYQFGYEGRSMNGNPTLWTGGLSALESAFAALGWAGANHEIPESRCDTPGCDKRADCGWPSPTGYRRTCGLHMRESYKPVSSSGAPETPQA